MEIFFYIRHICCIVGLEVWRWSQRREAWKKTGKKREGEWKIKEAKEKGAKVQRGRYEGERERKGEDEGDKQTGKKKKEKNKYIN